MIIIIKVAYFFICKREIKIVRDGGKRLFLTPKASGWLKSWLLQSRTHCRGCGRKTTMEAQASPWRGLRAKVGISDCPMYTPMLIFIMLLFYFVLTFENQV